MKHTKNITTTNRLLIYNQKKKVLRNLVQLSVQAAEHQKNQKIIKTQQNKLSNNTIIMEYSTVNWTVDKNEMKAHNLFSNKEYERR